MNSNQVELIDGGRNIKYIFNVPVFKYTAIQGDSATGKSTFYDIVVRLYEQKARNVSLNVYFSADFKIDLIPYSAFYRNYSDYHQCIVVIDEDDLYYDKKTKDTDNIFYIMKNSDNYFILITRDFGFDDVTIGSTNNVQSMPIRTFDVWKMQQSSDEDGMVINMLVPLYSNYYYENYNYPIIIDTILTEDDKSSFLFFEHIYNMVRNENLFSSNGKNGLLDKLVSIVDEGKNNILVVFDSCSFGLLFKSLLLYLRRNKNINIYLLDWESYEHYLLFSPNILINNNKEDIDNKILSSLFRKDKGIYTTEDAYEKVLKDYMHYYHKDNLCRCLKIDDQSKCKDCFRKLYNNKCNIDTDKKEIDYTHSPLDNFIINNINYHFQNKTSPSKLNSLKIEKLKFFD